MSEANFVPDLHERAKYLARLAAESPWPIYVSLVEFPDGSVAALVQHQIPLEVVDALQELPKTDELPSAQAESL